MIINDKAHNDVFVKQLEHSFLQCQPRRQNHETLTILNHLYIAKHQLKNAIFIFNDTQ